MKPNKPFAIRWWNGETTTMSDEQQAISTARRYRFDAPGAWGKVTFHPLGYNHHIYFRYDFSRNCWFKINSLTQTKEPADISRYLI